MWRRLLAPRVVVFVLCTFGGAAFLFGLHSALMMLLGAALAVCAGLLALVGSFGTSRWQFSIRAVLILTGVICVGLGWYVNRFAGQAKAVNMVLRVGGAVDYFETADGEAGFGERTVRMLFGDKYADDVRGISLVSTDVTDRELALLRYCTELQQLDLDYTQIGDKGLLSLTGLQKLEWLDVEDTAVTDEGLKSIAQLHGIRNLILDDNPITDEGIMQLKDMPNLTSVRLKKTRVTDEGIARLKEALPGCNVRR